MIDFIPYFTAFITLIFCIALSYAVSDGWAFRKSAKKKLRQRAQPSDSGVGWIWYWCSCRFGYYKLGVRFLCSYLTGYYDCKPARFITLYPDKPWDTRSSCALRSPLTSRMRISDAEIWRPLSNTTREVPARNQATSLSSSMQWAISALGMFNAAMSS